jgi:hypothetical protein
VGLATMFTVWPYLWNEPFLRIGEVIRYFTTVGEGYQVVFNGVIYLVGVGTSLWWYPWASLVIITPLPILFFAGTGCIRIISDIRKKKKEGMTGLFFLIWFIVPLLRAVMPSAAFYDGIRHFMEVLPPFILLAVFGIIRFPVGKMRFIPLIAGCIIIIHLMIVNTVYFPFSTGYYNILVKNPNTQFDRDIEALSMKEAVQYLHTTYGGIHVWVPLAGHLSWFYLNANDSFVHTALFADSIILINKSSHFSQETFHSWLGGAFVIDHTIVRGDAVYAWIYRRTN